MRKLIAAMKASLDGKIERADGPADWVKAWSDDYGLTPEIDACVLGGGMYALYEQYWTSIQTEPEKPAWITGTPPTPAEHEWAAFAQRTSHYVLSNTVGSIAWPNAKIIRSLDDIVALKQQVGKHIYLVGGAKTTASLIDAGLVDELRMIVYPLIAGEGKLLFAATERQCGLELKSVQQLSEGRVSLVYAVR
ncbi:MAG: dihydrofolate reductase family protein [Acidobacteriaceae bacterium]